jgi:hypothetical protein
MKCNPYGTAGQLKDDIDRGLAGDKIPTFDPAVAPLGTDEEAAGTPGPTAVLGAERNRHVTR